MYGAAPAYKQTMADYDGLKYGQKLDLKALFPPAFTLICVLLFVLPTAMLVYILRSPMVAPFTDMKCYILLLNPVIIAVVHLVHTTKKAPSKWGVISAIFIPAVLLMFISVKAMKDSGKVGNKLLSDDCEDFKPKAQIQRTWEAAYMAFDSCLNHTGMTATMPSALIMQSFRLPDCSEYSAVKAQSGQGWKYLQSLEQNEGCAGWCYPGQQLWSTGPAKDSCASSVAAAMKYFVKPHCQMVIQIMAFVIFFAAVTMPAVGRQVRAMGHSW